ncbi:MAG: hypothetical protein MI784_18005 [Cytophagales bacterium]|nr:hypothetical protein [Cytophagales bacterium]
MGIKNRVLGMLCGALFCIQAGHAQSVVLENNPAGVKWYQLNSEHFRLIYSEEQETEAQRMINTLEHIYRPVSSPLGVFSRKVDVVLQNRTSVSNGFVTLFPRHSEFFTTPPQDYNFLGTNDWLDMLAVHEYRHVVQNEQILQGKTKWLNVLLGTQGAATFSNLQTPEWFWEGDAVLVETALTHSGRGRIPQFSAGLKANLMEKGVFAYSKQALGSFRDFVPNHYVTGLYMTGYLRKKFDKNIWGNIQRKAMNQFWKPYSWSLATKKYTGKNTLENYSSAWDELAELWSNQLDSVSTTASDRLSPLTISGYTNYRYPQPAANGKVLALKSGFSDPSQFVWLNGDGKEERVYMPGQLNDPGKLSMESGKLVWVEINPDPRWRKQSYSNLYVLDTETGRRKKLTRRGRLASPVLSKDGLRVAAVETTLENEYRLVILNAGTGALLRTLQNTENAFLSMPAWSADGRKLVYLKHKNAQVGVFAFDLELSEESILMPYSYENVGHPVLTSNYLFYNSGISGIDNIYAMELSSRKKFQVTSVKYGAYNPSIDQKNGLLYFNEYNVNGNEIRRMALNPSGWAPMEAVKVRSLDYLKIPIEQTGQQDILQSVPKKLYAAKRYRQLPRLIHPYGWGVTANADQSSLLLGFVSRDVLSNMALSGGYKLDYLEGAGRWTAELSYQGLYPIVDVAADYGKRTKTTNERKLEWNELNLRTGLRIPMVFQNGRYINSLTARTQWAWTRADENHLKAPAGFPDEIFEGELYSMIYSLFYSRSLKTSKRDFYPRWGQSLYAYYRHTPFGGDFKSSIFTTRIRGYFPGFAKHHSFQLAGGYQYNGFKNYSLPSSALYPRGYSYRISQKLYTASAYYALPFAYPDWALGSVMNFQRIRGGIFTDLGRAENLLAYDKSANLYRFVPLKKNLFSVGGEVVFDVNLLRSLPLFGIGGQFAVVPEEGTGTFNILLNVAF